MNKIFLATLLITTLPLAHISAQEIKPLTAFQARDLAKKEVNNDAKDKVIEIYGPVSDISVLPSRWDVLFYDTTSEQDGKMVRVSGDKVTAILSGYTQLDQFRLAAYKTEEIISPERLKVDSPDVMAALKRNTALQKVVISGLEMRLRKPDKGDVAPIWYVDIFAVRKSDSKSIRIANARVSGQTGEIISLSEIDLSKLE